MNKTVKKLAIVLLVLTPIMVVIAFAQTTGEQRERSMRYQRGDMMMGLPDLTEEQRNQIQELHLNLMKETLPLRNEMNENRAKLKTLTTAENADMGAINKVIEANSKLQADMQKMAAQNHQNVRKLLTEDQRIIFDSGSGKRMAMRGRMHQFHEGGKEGFPGMERRLRQRRPAPENEE